MPTMISWAPTFLLRPKLSLLVINPLHACRAFSIFRTVVNIGKLKTGVRQVFYYVNEGVLYEYYNNKNMPLLLAFIVKSA